MARQEAAADKTPKRLVRGVVLRGASMAPTGDSHPQLFISMCTARPLGAVAMPVYQNASAEEILPALQAAKTTCVFARMRRWSEFSTKGGSK